MAWFDTGWVTTYDMYLGCGTGIRCSGNANRTDPWTVNFSGYLEVSQYNSGYNANAIYGAVNGYTGWQKITPYGYYRKDGSSYFSFNVNVGTPGGYRTLDNIFQVWNNAESGGVGGVAHIYCDAWYDQGASAPTGVGGANLDIGNNTEDGRAYSRVDVGSWGAGSGQAYFIVAKANGGSSWVEEWAASTSTNYLWWGGTHHSNSTSSCAITAWWPEACNNNSLRSYGSAKYIASPSAPITTAIGSVSNPSLTISGTINYSGGDQNSSTCNNGTIKYWRFHYKKTSDGSYVNMTPEYSSERTYTLSSLPKETFVLGTNYNIVTRVRNSLGAHGDSYQTVYCPTGVSGTVSENTPTSFIINCSATYAGTLASSTGGTMAQYIVKYSTDKATVDGGGGTAMPVVVNPSTSCTISGLTPGTTYYYRVYGWNVLGLSQVSSTLVNTTVPRFYPESYPLTLTAKNIGADVKIKIKHTGGLTTDELPISTLTLYRKPVGSSTWEQVGSPATGLSLTKEQEYTFVNAWTQALPSEGDYNVRILMSNGIDEDFSPTYTITAPTNVSVLRYRETNDCPIQINADVNGSATNGVHHWRLSWQNQSIDYVEKTTTSTYTQLHSRNYLLYDTTYSYWATLFDNFGCWRKSASLNTTTDKRFEWSAIVNGVKKSATPIFGHFYSNYAINEVYYIVKNSLGSKGLRMDLRNTRLKFITGTLNYRPENVASIKLANGKEIAYRLDESVDRYKFGIWNDGAIETTFHDGLEWKMTSYDIPNTTGYTVAETHHTGKGMNSSSPFSTTNCSEIPMWENQ